jgi:hypothetical protein
MIMKTLENGVGSKSRRNEQVAHSEAECHAADDLAALGCYESTTIDDGQAGGVGGGGSHLPPSPLFLVPNKDNVNAQIHRAKGLLAMWDYLVHKGRIGRTQVILNRKDDPSTLRIMPVKCRCRYFDEGRSYMSRKIRRRLGKYEKVPGLMETLTYDPKKIGKQEAWASFGKDTRRFLNAVNQYRKRKGQRRLHYFWVVEVQKETGYPHVHIFFPNLGYLAPFSILNSSWSKGRANLALPTKINTNCAAYVSKYLRKMQGWSDLHLALLWSGKCRMYGFSRGFSVKVEKKESEWERWRIIETYNLEEMEYNLMKGGYVIDITYANRSSPVSLN